MKLVNYWTKIHLWSLSVVNSCGQKDRYISRTGITYWSPIFPGIKYIESMPMVKPPNTFFHPDSWEKIFRGKNPGPMVCCSIRKVNSFYYNTENAESQS